jgi:SAM-dependent methyltransferase
MSSPSETDLEAATIAFYRERPQDFERIEPEGFPWELGDAILRSRNLMGDDPLLLDAGCGGGRFAEYVKQFGIQRYIGVDISEGLIAIARERYPNSDFRVGDIHSLCLNVLEQCDTFIACASLNHISRSRMDSALCSIRSVLRPGAVGFISTPLGTETFVVPTDRLPGVAPGYNILMVQWTPETLEPHLNRAGFEIMDAHEVGPAQLFTVQTL